MSRSVPFSAAAFAAAIASVAAFPAYSQNATPSNVETLVAALGTGDTPVLALCQTAGSEPAAFDVLRGTAQFEAAMVAMTPYCPELVLLLTDIATASLPTADGSGDGDLGTAPGGDDVVDGGGGGGDGDGGVDAPNFAGLIDALNGATARLNGATEEVGFAQEELLAAIGQVRSSGIELRAALFLTDDESNDNTGEYISDEAEPTVLPDFTAQQLRALDRLKEARERLTDAKVELDNAKAGVTAELEGLSANAATALRDYLVAQNKLAPDATQEDKDAAVAGLINELSAALTSAADAVTDATRQRSAQLTALQQEFPELALDPIVAVGTQITSYQTGLGTTKSQVQSSIDAIQSVINGLTSQLNMAQTTLTQAQQRLAGAALQLSTAQTEAARELSERNAAQTLLNNARNAETLALNSAIATIANAAATCPGQGPCSVRNLNNQLQGKTVEEQRQILLTANLQGNLPVSVSGAVNTFRNANAATAPLQNALTQAENELVAANQLVTTMQGFVAQDTASVTSAQNALGNLNTQIQQQQGLITPLQTQITTISGQINRLTEILDALNEIDGDLPGLEGAKEAAAQAQKDLQDKLDALSKAAEDLLNAEAIANLQTPDEQAAVTRARGELQAAVDHAQRALGLGRGEAEALQAVQDARARLDAAIAEQNDAAGDGVDLVESVTNPDATPDLRTAVDGLNEAIEVSDASGGVAQDDAAQGQAVEDAYHASNSALDEEINSVLANELKDLADLEEQTTSDESGDTVQQPVALKVAASVAETPKVEAAPEEAPAASETTQSAPSSDTSSTSESTSSSDTSSSSSESSSSSDSSSSSESTSSSSESTSSSDTSTSTDTSSPSESTSTSGESTGETTETTEQAATE